MPLSWGIFSKHFQKETNIEIVEISTTGVGCIVSSDKYKSGDKIIFTLKIRNLKAYIHCEVVHAFNTSSGNRIGLFFDHSHESVATLRSQEVIKRMVDLLI